MTAVRLTGSLVLAVCSLAACKSRQNNAVVRTTPAVDSSGNTATMRTFFDGLLAAPGTAARIRAGEILAARLARMLAVEPQASPRRQSDIQLRWYGAEPAGRDLEQRVLTKRIVEQTIAYLRAPTATPCSPSEKIRVYRGTRALPWIKAAGDGGPGVSLIGDWTSGIVDELEEARNAGTISFSWPTRVAAPVPGRPAVTGDDLGSVILANAASLSRYSLANFEFEKIFMERDPNNWARWDHISQEHTNDNEFPSPNVSTSLSWRQADTFGPGFATIEVCPERALLVTGTTNFLSEMEVYIPLFILPEEVVRLEAVDCAVAMRTPGSLVERDRDYPRERCYSGHFSDPDPENPRTRAARSCFFDNDPPTDLDTALSELRTTQRFTAISERVNSAYALATGGTSGIRTAVRDAINTVCALDCDAERRIYSCAKRNADYGGSEEYHQRWVRNAEQQGQRLNDLCRIDPTTVPARGPNDRPRCPILSEDALRELDEETGQ